MHAPTHESAHAKSMMAPTAAHKTAEPAEAAAAVAAGPAEVSAAGSKELYQKGEIKGPRRWPYPPHGN